MPVPADIRKICNMRAMRRREAAEAHEVMRVVEMSRERARVALPPAKWVGMTWEEIQRSGLMPEIKDLLRRMSRFPGERFARDYLAWLKRDQKERGDSNVN